MKEDIINVAIAGIGNIASGLLQGISYLQKFENKKSKLLHPNISSYEVKNIRIVVNKVTNDEDAEFVKSSLSDYEIIGMIPYSDEIRHADRKQVAILSELSPELNDIFKDILSNLEK